MFNNEEINRQYRKINVLITVIKTLEPEDEMKSHLTKYVCVLCSGFIENSVYYVFSDIAEKGINNCVALTYAKSQLFKIQNANSEKIRALAKSFNANWGEPLTTFMSLNERSAAINYILKDRHNIAHGRNSDITIDRLEERLLKFTEVLLYIENTLDTIE